MKIKNFYGRSMKLVNGEGDPNFAEFMKVEGGSQSSPDPEPEPEPIEPDPNEPDPDPELNEPDPNEPDPGEPKPDQTIQMLQDQISNLTNLVSSIAGKKNEPAPVEPEPEIDIFESEDFTSLAEGMSWDDKEKTLMKSFLTKALEANSKTTIKAALNDLPEIVNSSVNANQTQKEIRKNFLSEHSALVPVQKYVAELASGIAAENQKNGKKASIAEVLAEAAEQSYKNLGIKKVEKQSKAESRGGKLNPAFPKNRSNSRKPSPKTTKMQNDISAIMSLDN